MAQQAVGNLQRVLLAARKVHNEAEYRAMSAPVLLELQRWEHEVLEYLSHVPAEIVGGELIRATQAII